VVGAHVLENVDRTTGAATAAFARTASRFGGGDGLVTRSVLAISRPTARCRNRRRTTFMWSGAVFGVAPLQHLVRDSTHPQPVVEIVECGNFLLVFLFPTPDAWEGYDDPPYEEPGSLRRHRHPLPKFRRFDAILQPTQRQRRGASMN